MKISEAQQLILDHKFQEFLSAFEDGVKQAINMATILDNKYLPKSKSPSEIYAMGALDALDSLRQIMGTI